MNISNAICDIVESTTPYEKQGRKGTGVLLGLDGVNGELLYGRLRELATGSFGTRRT